MLLEGDEKLVWRDENFISVQNVLLLPLTSSQSCQIPGHVCIHTQVCVKKVIGGGNKLM